MNFDISILEYLGTVKNGVLVLVGIMFQGEYYEGTFFYNEKDIILTISDELESKIGDIKKLKQYPDVLRSILRKVVPFNEIYERLDPVDFARWVNKVIEEGVKNPNITKKNKF